MVKNLVRYEFMTMSIKISTDAFAAFLKIKPGQVVWATKRGDFEGVPMPLKDAYGKYKLADVIKFKSEYEKNKK